MEAFLKCAIQNVACDLHSCMADRNVWFGVMKACGSSRLVTGETLCFSSQAFIAMYSYVKPSAATYGSSITSCITQEMLLKVHC